MKFNYDTVADAVYFTLNKGKVRKTVEINGVVVDVGSKGKIIGIEILNFSLQQNKKSLLNKFAKDGVPLQINKKGLAIA